MEAKIKKIIENVVMGYDSGALSADDQFREKGIDSLDVFAIMNAVEKEFNIQLSDDEVEACNSINDIIRCVVSRQI